MARVNKSNAPANDMVTRAYQVELEKKSVAELYNLRDKAMFEHDTWLARAVEVAIVKVTEREMAEKAKQADEYARAMKQQIAEQKTASIKSDWWDYDKGPQVTKTHPMWSGALTASTAGAIRGANPAPVPAPDLHDWSERQNHHVFKGITDKTVVDVGVIGEAVCITFRDGNVLTIRSLESECRLVEQSHLETLNGYELGDIVVNPQYSIAGEMNCLLVCYSRHGAAISFAVFCKYKPTFKLEYTHEKS